MEPAQLSDPQVIKKVKHVFGGESVETSTVVEELEAVSTGDMVHPEVGLALVAWNVQVCPTPLATPPLALIMIHFYRFVALY